MNTTTPTILCPTCCGYGGCCPECDGTGEIRNRNYISDERAAELVEDRKERHDRR